MVEVFVIPELFDPASEVFEMLSLLPEWRRRKALSYRRDIDRFLCAKSFLMLEEMLRNEYGLEHCPEFCFGSRGKPYFKERPDIHFNISHCPKAVACAVSDTPVGIDIEQFQFDRDVAEMSLSPEEFQAVAAAPDPEILFTELWTRKESLLKLTGEGLSDDLRNILGTAAGVSFRTEIKRESGYVVTEAVPLA